MLTVPPPPAAGHLCTQHEKRRARGRHCHAEGGPRGGGAADPLRDPGEDLTGLFFRLPSSNLTCPALSKGVVVDLGAGLPALFRYIPGPVASSEAR